MDFVIDAEPTAEDEKEDLKALVEKNKAQVKAVDPETGEVLPDELQK